MSPYSQDNFEIRCEWGAEGVALLAPISDVVIIVDFLSFTTCVEVATSRGAWVYPYHARGKAAEEYTTSVGALLADKRNDGTIYSLSPTSLQTIPHGTKLVLPSPNGSTLTLGTGDTPTLAGSLLNAAAVAYAAQRMGRTISVIAAGERWRTDGSLRPSFEDLVGAGAIISHLTGTLSPEAFSAVSVFRAALPDLDRWISQCASGRELVEKGFGDDVRIASAYNVSDTVPYLQEGKYQAR